MLKKHLVALALILTISLLTFKDSFSLSLFGDDWLVLFIFIKQMSAIGTASAQFGTSSYFSPYGFTYLFMGLVYSLFGFNPPPYFIASFLLRFLAASSLYAFLYHFTKNRVGAAMGTIFFSISEIGLETTNWVFNANSYVGIALFLVFFIVYHRSQTQIGLKRLLSLILSLILFCAAIVSVPVKMHGAFLLILAIEFFTAKKFRNVIRFLVMSFLWVVIFLMLRRVGVFGVGEYNVNHYINESLEKTVTLLKSGRTDHLLTPLTTIGNMLFPDVLMDRVEIPRIIFKIIDLSWMKSFLIPLWVLNSFIMLISLRILTPKSWRYNLILFSAIGFLWIYLINNFILKNPITFSHPKTVFLTTIGGFFLLIIFILLISLRKQKTISLGLLFSIAWLFSFAAVPMIYSPTNYIVSSMRYLIVPGIGIAIAIGFLLSSKAALFQKTILALLLSPLFYFQLSATQNYFANLNKTRGQKIDQQIWRELLAKTPEVAPNEPQLFYFETENTNSSTLRDVITFGFIPRMILYGRADPKIPGPFIVLSQGDLASALTDGESIKGLNFGNPIIFPWERTYTFKLDRGYNLIDIKNTLKKEFQNLNVQKI